ncbi:MAG: porphobilinogen synthase [Candidatus Eremiobacteraeota bacterium]|nr:porphobilinogen synthase [Candidatus Eremiobacteraeota bacterium]MBV8366415.1 porphobilinogen synthase [Candidatus Eremiobacteraeota bacterium]
MRRIVQAAQPQPQPSLEPEIPTPLERPRRLRRFSTMRALVAEHAVRVEDLIEPMFVVPGSGVRTEIGSMPGVYHQSVDRIVEDARAAHDLGIPGVILFGIPERKDEAASGLTDPSGPVQRAAAALKRALPELLVIADLCACEYTSHGHCGLLDANANIDNDRTLTLLAAGAVSLAAAGVDVVAPSDMMDGRVRAIRLALDARGFSETAILSYAVKYASAFYGPFREAAASTPAFGDRRTHQMDPANAREAVREALLDVAEGADIVMVKPALGYLDVVLRVRAEVNVPVAVYNTSGEYAMIKAAGAKGWIDEPRAVDEILVSCKRAGADMIITYFARAAAARR